MISLPTRTDLDVVLEFSRGYGLGYGHGKSCPILASTPGSGHGRGRNGGEAAW